MESSAFIQGLIIFIGTGNITGACTCLDNLWRRGWRPVTDGLHERIVAMFKSNMPGRP